ncbi:MAG: tyrosine protein phosphatase [Pseudomonadota bacterium]
MILVCPLSLVEETIASHGPSHLISLLDPVEMIATPAGVDPERHLKVGVNDVRAPAEGAIAPERSHVENILAFAETWDGDAPLLAHCWAGISRSTAAAFILMCAREPQTAEAEHANRIRAASPHAYPNSMLVAHADEILDRGGRMIDAVEQMEPGEPAWEGVLFSLPLAGPRSS